MSRFPVVDTIILVNLAVLACPRCARLRMEDRSLLLWLFSAERLHAPWPRVFFQRGDVGAKHDADLNKTTTLGRPWFRWVIY